MRTGSKPVMVKRLPGLDPEETDITEIDFKEPRHADESMARRIALQVLYEADVAGHFPGLVMARVLDERQPAQSIAVRVRELVEGVFNHYPDIDPLIAKFAPEFPLDQIAVIDRNILRMAIFEFAVDAGTPVGAAIDEAVELSKVFGADGSASFTNGVLGAIASSPDNYASLRGTAPGAPAESEN
jgi:transcription antitermination protein NusB